MGEKKELRKAASEKDKEIELLKARLFVAESDVDRLDKALQQALAEFSRINAELVSVYSSKRWKLTESLSNIKQTFKKAEPAPIVTKVTEESGFHIDENQKTALVMDRTVPMPDKDAGSKAALGYMEILQDMGYGVLFMGEDFALPEPYTKQMEDMGIRVLGGAYYRNNWKSWLVENATKINLAVVSRPNVARRFLHEIKQKTNAKVLYMGQDLHFLRLMREQEWSEAIQDSDVELQRAMELVAMSDADATLMYSDVECGMIHDSFGIEAQTIPLYFYKEIPERKEGFSATADLLFVGGFQHHPNVDAMKWFVADVLPLIKRELPDVKLFIVGANPTEEILALQSADVVVTGFVLEEELEEYYNKCRVCVVPLRYGAGVKGKTLEALYHGIPIVSTAIGIEGMPGIEQLVPPADQAQEFAQRVAALYTDETAWQRQSQAYKKYLLEHYSYESAKGVMERIINEL